MAFEIAFETAARVSVPPERALKAHEGPRSQVGGGFRASWEGEEVQGETCGGPLGHRLLQGNNQPGYFLKKIF